MTISSDNRQAGPYVGNDLATAFSFAFKVFIATDLQVVRTDPAGVESTLTLNADYTVTLNSNQDSNPGGTVTLPIALASGYKLTITSILTALQTTDLTNQGGFYPKVITNALDKLTILIQQALNGLGRSLKFPISETLVGVTLPPASQRANQYVGFDSAGNVVTRSGTVVFNAADSATVGFLQSGASAVARDVQSKLREVVSVKDFGAIGDGTDATAAFNLAATASKLVKVPYGTYLISSATTSSTVWELEPGALITGLPDLNDGQLPIASINNTSRLTGRIMRHQNTDFGAGILVGDSDPWMEQYIRPSSLSRAEFAAVSPNGQIAITGASKISDNPTTAGTDMSCIGGNFYAINDRAQVDAETTTAYAVYAEARRRPSGGAAFGMEVDIANQDAVVPLTPNSPLSYAEYNGGIIVNSGAGLTPASLYPASFGMLFGANGSNFLRGIVFNDGSVDSSTSEAVSMPISYKHAWYDGGSAVSALDHRNHQRKIDTDTASIGIEDNNIRAHASYADSANLDVIYKNTSYGYLSGNPYQGVFTRVLQRSPFAASNARFSFDVDAKNADGSSAQVSLNGIADNTFSPGNSDNVLKLGGPSFRWNVVYAGTGTINTSDAREKQQIRPLWDSEKAVARRLKSLIRAFRFNDAVEEKGDKARIHIGMIAQDIKAAFEAEGLDPFAYSILCYDEWESSMDWVIGPDGEEHPKYTPAGSRYGVRYEEILAFVLGAI